MFHRTPWTTARVVAAVYLGLTTAGALAYAFAGRPDAWGFPMALATFPGGVILTVLVAYVLAPAIGSAPGVTEADIEGDLADGGLDLLDALLGVVFHTAGALVNVLIVLGICRFARLVLREVRLRGNSGN